MVKPATARKELVQSRAFAGGLHQFDFRVWRGANPKKRYPRFLQGIMDDFLVPFCSDRIRKIPADVGNRPHDISYVVEARLEGPWKLGLIHNSDPNILPAWLIQTIKAIESSINGFAQDFHEFLRDH